MSHPNPLTALGRGCLAAAAFGLLCLTVAVWLIAHTWPKVWRALWP